MESGGNSHDNKHLQHAGPSARWIVCVTSFKPHKTQTLLSSTFYEETQYSGRLGKSTVMKIQVAQHHFSWLLFWLAGPLNSSVWHMPGRMLPTAPLSVLLARQDLPPMHENSLCIGSANRSCQHLQGRSDSWTAHDMVVPWTISVFLFSSPGFLQGAAGNIENCPSVLMTSLVPFPKLSEIASGNKKTLFHA